MVSHRQLRWTVLLALASACEGATVNLGRAPAEAPPPTSTIAADASGPAIAEAAAPMATAPAPSVDAAGQQSEQGADAGGERDAGRSREVPLFDAPQLVSELNTDEKDDNPTLTADLLEIYLSSDRNGDSDVWYATRQSIDQPFSEPQHLAVVSTDDFDSSPAVEADGLSLWVGSESAESAGGVDIWVSRRNSREEPWLTPELVVELNSEYDDIPRPTGSGSLTMPLASRRDQDFYQSYLATRPTPDAPFTELRRLDELIRDDAAMGDAFLSGDGLSLYFAYAMDGRGDLYVAFRDSVDAPFHDPLPLDTINGEADDRDPWLSPDGSLLYFASDREGDLNIYSARRL